MSLPENHRKPGECCAQLRTVPTGESIQEVSEHLDTWLEEFDIPMAVGYKLHVVLDEVYSNIVRYSGAKEAVLSFCQDADTVTLHFADDGVPYDPLTAETPDITASAQDRAVGGLGLFMVRKLALDMSYSHTQGQNRLAVTLSKNPRKKPAGKGASDT